MTFEEILDQALAMLQRRGRVTYRTLKLQFNLNDDQVEAVKEELLYSHSEVVDEQGKGLVWIDDARVAPTPVSPRAIDQQPAPLSYTPQYLAEKILTTRPALEGERKQVTVLFADIQGSTELITDLDPEAAQQLLDPAIHRMMEAVHRYEGTVNQVLGDGIMALFGAPIAHEDHALRACYAALAMQAAMQAYADEVRRVHGLALRIRVGLNSGEVVVRAIGNDLHMDYSAVGQTTHLAARMEQLAAPGSILLAAPTLRLVEALVRVNALGPIPVKGLAEPVEVFELLGASAVRRRLQATAAHGLTRFVGRDTELEALQQALEPARAGHGQVVALVGEAGVGKSRLVYEMVHSHRTQGWLVLETASVSYGKATPYFPVLDLLKRYVHAEDRDETRTIRAKVTGQVLTLDERLQDTIPALLALLDALPDDSPFVQLDPPQRRQRTFEALKRLLLRESQVQPVLLVLEDLHWIDAETQALLDILVDSLPTSRLLLLVNYRPEYQHTWGSKTYYTQLRLDPLPPASADALLQALLGNDPSLAPLKQLLIERTGGNPFFLEETVRTLVETGVLVGAPGAYRVARDLPTIQVPATVQAVLAARIDRLPPEEKHLLQTAAAIGNEVPLPLLQAIAEVPEEALHRSLAHLQAVEFLYETRLFPEREYTFKHALTHEVAYSSLLQERRQALHAGIVEAIERLYGDRLAEQVERLAQHALRGEVWDKAVTYLREAGAKAFMRSASADAVAYFTQGLDVVKILPATLEWARNELELRIALGPALMTVKGYGAPEVARAYARARELCRHVGQDPELFAVLHGLWLHYWLRGDIRTVLDLAPQLYELGQRAEDRALRMVAHEVMGEVTAYLGDFRAARAHMEQAITLYDPGRHHSLGFRYGGYDPGMAGRAIGAHALWYLGHPDQALKWSREAVALARELSQPHTLGFALGHAGILHYHRREPRPTLDLAQEAIALSAEHGIEFWEAFAEILCGWSLVQQGRGSEGIERMRHGLAGYRVTAGELESPLWLAMIADAYRVIGKPEEGLLAVAEGLDLVEVMGVRFEEAELHRLRGELLLAQGGAAAADAESGFRRALEVAAGQEARSLELRAARSLACLLQHQGSREPACQMLAEVYGWFTEGFGTADLQEAKALLEELGE
jgi:class 3 adenylate cyclase/predicted ATPase